MMEEKEDKSKTRSDSTKSLLLVRLLCVVESGRLLFVESAASGSSWCMKWQ